MKNKITKPMIRKINYKEMIMCLFNITNYVEMFDPGLSERERYYQWRKHIRTMWKTIRPDITDKEFECYVRDMEKWCDNDDLDLIELQPHSYNSFQCDRKIIN